MTQESRSPVTVPSLPRDDFALSVLHRLEAGGFAQPILQGGALRDAFMRHAQPRDLDVWANFGKAAGDRPLHQCAPAYFNRLIEELFPGAEILHSDPLTHTTSLSDSWGRIIFKFEDRTIDLHLTTQPCDIDTLSMITDAPLNGVAMDRHGVTKAHPLFTMHAEQRVYAPLPTIETNVAEARFNHLQTRIPGLRMEKPEII